MKHALFATSLAAALVAAVPVAASADTLDLAGGAMSTSGNSSSFAGILSLHGVGLPLPGLHPQLSFALPTSTGNDGGSQRYALTAEGLSPIAPHGTFLGAGVGIGRLNPFRTGAVADVLAGTQLAPHIILEGRYYGALSNDAGQGTFVGLGFRL